MYVCVYVLGWKCNMRLHYKLKALELSVCDLGGTGVRVHYIMKGGKQSYVNPAARLNYVLVTY